MTDSSTEPMRIETGDFAAVRVIFIAAGIFVIGIAVYELGRGVWPPNILSLFFLFMILGACTVGGPTIMGGLFGEAATWDITPGLISIALKNPFRKRVVRLTPDRVLGISVIEQDHMEGENTWLVEVITSTERFRTPDYGSSEKAEAVRADIERIFRGQF
ncbi:MAG: hypothetical protein KF914_01440 [Rhizobiaceae bacterium]|nr:hypothetical protein [Rhizobiaceae bacterium]